MPSSQRYRNCVFTINNPSEGVPLFNGLPEGVAYVIWQLERGAQGTPHFQGYMRFSKRKTLSDIKRLLRYDTAHIEPARGSEQQCVDYCSKAETKVAGPWEFGVRSKSGDRTDLAEAAKIIIDTGNLSQVDPAILMKHAGNCVKIASLCNPPRRDGLQVFLIVGKTGIGKSYSVRDLYPDLYMPFYGNSGLWWDGYSGQDVVLFEEFRGQVPLTKMLQLLDPYPIRLEVKGGAMPARYTKVFITSNTPPEEWYPNDPTKPNGSREGERQALFRRLGLGTPRYINAATRAELHEKLSFIRAMVPPPPPPPPNQDVAMPNQEPSDVDMTAPSFDTDDASSSDDHIGPFKLFPDSDEFHFQNSCF